MIYAFAILYALTLTICFVLLDRQNKRHVAHVVKLNADHMTQVQCLLQRIQAPEVAVVQHQVETSGPATADVPLTEWEAAARESDRLLQMIADMEAAEANR